MEICHSHLFDTYLGDCKKVKPRNPKTSDVLAKDTHKKEEDMTKTLYQITTDEDNIIYGTHLATNSKGQWVMEVKGTGVILSVDPKKVEEVIPYSISVQFFGKSTDYSYLAPEGKYQVGDVFAVEGQYGYSLAIVTAVNTKSKASTKEFSPTSKILSEKA